MSTVLIVLLWVSAAFLTFGALASIATIGKPRGPLDHKVAVLSAIFTAIIVGTLIAAAFALS